MNTLFANIYLALQTVGNKIRREEQGATAVEYGIMVAGIAVAIIVIVFALGEQLDALFTTVSDELPAAPAGV